MHLRLFVIQVFWFILLRMYNEKDMLYYVLIDNPK